MQCRVVSIVVVKKKRLVLSSNLVAFDSTVDLLSINENLCEFEELNWKSTDKISVQLFVDFINGIGKLFNGHDEKLNLPINFT